MNNGILKVNNDIITIETMHNDCIMQDENQLSSLIKNNNGEIDKQNCYNLIELFITEIFEWFGKEISISLIKSLAITIYQNYYWLRIAEFKLFVEKIKAGHWKQMHNFTAAVFTERLKEFSEESIIIRENIAQQNKIKEGEIFGENAEIISNILQKTIDKINLTIEKRNKERWIERQKIIEKTEQKNIWQNENTFCFNWLNSIEEDDNLKLQWYNLFLKRKN